MVNYQGAPLEEQVKKLLEQNLAYSKEIYHISKKIKHYIMWGRIMSAISILIFIVLPIILGIVYLPSILNNTINNFLPPGISQPDAVQELLGNEDINQQDLMKMIEDQGGILNAYKNVLNMQNQ